MKHRFVDGPLKGQVREGDGPRVVSLRENLRGKYVRKVLDQGAQVAVYKWTVRGFKEKKSEECACCHKQATGFEPRFGYYYCNEHASVAPVDIARLKDAKGEKK